MKKFFLVASIFLVACGEKSEDKVSESDKDNTEQQEDDNQTVDNAGTIVLGTANLSAVLTEANTELNGAGKELDLEPGFIDALPAGSIEVGGEKASLLEGDSVLKSYTWNLTRVEISEDAKTWVEVYKGDPIPFELIQGTGADGGITSSTIPEGDYKYLYMEIGEITWQRAAAECTEVNSMGQMNLAGLLTTGAETAQYHGGENIFEKIRNATDRGAAFDEISQMQTKSPKELLNENGLAASDSIEYDEQYWYLHEPIAIEEGEKSPIAITIVPDADFSKGGLCDEGPGKPQFLVGSLGNIAKAVANQGVSRSK